MAARPPSDNIDDEPDITEFGIVALDARVDEWDVSFPIRTDELANEYGEERIAFDPAGHEIALKDALGDCPQDSFERKQELLNAMHPVFEDKRERLSGTLLGKLRALVPF